MKPARWISTTFNALLARANVLPSTVDEKLQALANARLPVHIFADDPLARHITQSSGVALRSIERRSRHLLMTGKIADGLRYVERSPRECYLELSIGLPEALRSASAGHPLSLLVDMPEPWGSLEILEIREGRDNRTEILIDPKWLALEPAA